MSYTHFSFEPSRRALLLGGLAGLLYCGVPPHASSAEEPPALRDSPSRFIECIEATGRANLLAARANVTRDIAQKRIRIFSLSLEARQTQRLLEGYQVEVIYLNDLATVAKSAAAPYHEQHNLAIWSFAAAEYEAGRRNFSLQLMRLLAASEPDLFWSTPQHKPMTIRQIIIALEGADPEAKNFVTDQAQQWKSDLKLYGPPQQKTDRPSRDGTADR